GRGVARRGIRQAPPPRLAGASQGRTRTRRRTRRTPRAGHPRSRTPCPGRRERTRGSTSCQERSMNQITDPAGVSPLEARVIAGLRTTVGKRLAAWAGDEAYSAREREQRGRELINAALAERTAAAISSGGQVLNSAAEQRVAKAVFDALFGLG